MAVRVHSRAGSTRGLVARLGWLFGSIALLLLSFVGSARLPLEWDLTANGRNTLSPISRELARQGDGARITAFFPQSSPTWESARRLIDSYHRENAELTVRYIDPDTHPSVARDYGLTVYGTIYVENGAAKREVLGTNEREISTALSELLGRKEQVLCALTGHGERSVTEGDPLSIGSFAARLPSVGIRVRETTIAGAEGLRGCDAAFAADPASPLLSEEAATWRDFLRTGGKALVLLEPGRPAEIATSWLEGWPVSFSPLRVADPAGSLVDDSSALVTARYPSEHPITKGAPPVFLVGSGSLDAVDPAGEGGLSLSRLVETSPESKVEGLTESGKRLLALAFDKSRAIPGTAQVERSRLVVVADTDWISNAHIGDLGNSVFALGAASWLVKGELLPGISDSGYSPSVVTVSSADARRVFIQMVVVPPSLLLALGVLVFFKRRKDRS